jgi:two-component system, sensor histidine kinase and response regulator
VGGAAARVPLITRHTVAEARVTAPARILVAEDNAVNQRVALGLLERLGYRADVVADGAEAVEAVACRPYDLVLLDCQMPVMDGYEAAARIRRSEPAGHRIPIVAMTADALAADRERCMAAGMDDHVAKPVDRNQLRDVLRRWLPADAGAPEETPAPAVPHEGLIEPGQLRSIVGDDATAARRYLTLYVETADELVRRAAAAMADRDGTTLRRLAHNLKGTSGNVGAVEVARLAARLEQAAAGTDWPATTACWSDMESAFTRTVAHVRSLQS